jgi:hypothetical protein
LQNRAYEGKEKEEDQVTGGKMELLTACKEETSTIKNPSIERLEIKKSLG